LNRDETVLRCNVGFSCSTTGEKHVFRWLTKQVQPFTVDDLIEDFAPGHRARMARLDERYEAEDRQRHEKEIRKLKKARLEQELKDAEWILDYEKRLINLQKRTATQRSRAEQVGTNTDRLRRLEHHLAGLRRSLD
jgi:hypothetical protein